MDVATSAADHGKALSAAGLGVRRSLLWNLAVPTCIAVGLLIATICLYTPSAVVDAAIEDAIRHGEETAGQLRTLRSFYSDNVVSKAKKAGTKASPTYKEDPIAIPVPTTFILDIADAFSTGDVKVSLVSPFPWPTRADRTLDDFQRDAWDHLSKNPDGRFVRREQVLGRDVLRVAVGDRMEASCVSCHNGDPRSPRKDWKIGDVRGLIEVDRPIDAVAREAGHLSLQLVTGSVLAGTALLILLLMNGMRLIRPLRDLTKVIHRIARGRPEVVPHVGRADELGTVARALVFLQEQTSERARAEAQISHMAYHDTLTGLPNRLLFNQELKQAFERAQRGEPFAVLCIDLDQFKVVNDTLGHPVGDVLLKKVACQIQDCLSQNDICARLGGDEFAVLQAGGDLTAGVDMPVGAAILAGRIVERLNATYHIEGHQIMVGASVGIAVAPTDGTDADTLVKNADLALYRAKADGRGAHCFFEPEMDAKMQARRSMELDLRMALAKGEFEVYYQPLVNLERKAVCGFEALLRWNHPARGLVQPGSFIPLAEEIGIIAPIGIWVLRTACREAATWPGNVKVAVNLSALQIKSKTLVLDVAAALGASGLSPGRLELEITETVILQDSEATLTVLHQLRALGLRISMDDFGTGHSSLSYLRSFPFDKIKIDKSFVCDISEADESAAIVRAVTGLGMSFGMATTAEGVETEQQLLRLREEGCTEVQGYLFSPPRPAKDIAWMIQIARDVMRRAA